MRLKIHLPKNPWACVRGAAVLVLISVGAGLIYLPAGLIVAGVLIAADLLTD